MSCPQLCVSCCSCCIRCCPCAEREKKRRKSYIEYSRHTPEPLDTSVWPTKDQRVPISCVLADTPDVPHGYGLDEVSPVTQQPRLGSPRLVAAGRRRQSQPVLPGTHLVHSQPSSPFMGRRISQPALRRESLSPRRRASTVSPQHQVLSPLEESPLHGAAMAGRRRSVQMASLHEDFYSESEASTIDEEEDASLLKAYSGSEYETSVTSEDEGDGDQDSVWDTSSLPLLPPHPKPKHSSTIPQIIVTEPFEIGPNPTLQYSLYYDFKRDTLIVHLQKAFNLPPREVDKETCDPFVIVYLVPNRETDRETYETSVIANTVNPNFDEMFQFPRLKPDDARKQTLVFRIYHQCGPKHNILIGGVIQPLEGVDFHGKTIRKRIVEDVEEYQVRSCNAIILLL